MSNKQSSIEWLFYKLWQTQKDKLNWHSLLKQAKTMHKEEIIHAYNQSWHFRNLPYETGEKYYNETFGGNNDN